LFPRGTTLIVVTPNTQDEWAVAARQLTRRGLRLVTVLIDPESFGGRRSSAKLAALLQSSGMMAYLIRRGDNLTAVLSQNPKRANSFTV
jgi:hypothetical protein